jgi:hypothetical protein
MQWYTTSVIEYEDIILCISLKWPYYPFHWLFQFLKNVKEVVITSGYSPLIWSSVFFASGTTSKNSLSFSHA